MRGRRRAMCPESPESKKQKAKSARGISNPRRIPRRKQRRLVGLRLSFPGRCHSHVSLDLPFRLSRGACYEYAGVAKRGFSRAANLERWKRHKSKKSHRLLLSPPPPPLSLRHLARLRQSKHLLCAILFRGKAKLRRWIRCRPYFVSRETFDGCCFRNLEMLQCVNDAPSFGSVSRFSFFWMMDF